MKTIVIYKSKTGFSKKYSEWIAEDLSADIVEYSEFDTNMFKDYDTILYGGGLYAVGINGIKLLKKNLSKLKDNNLIVFATGASPGRTEEIMEVKNKNFTSEEQKYLSFYYLRGGFDYDKLKFADKILMKLLKLKLKRKDNLTPDERGMLRAYDKSVDFTLRKNIKDIISYVNS